MVPEAEPGALPSTDALGVLDVPVDVEDPLLPNPREKKNSAKRTNRTTTTAVIMPLLRAGVAPPSSTYVVSFTMSAIYL